jgi:AcrR family transcriptional regulator
MPRSLRARARHPAPPEERRAQILAAALRCFSEKGYHAATMDDLARAASLSKGSLYWYFASKEQVFAALFGAFTFELLEAWEAEAARHQGGMIELIGRVGELSLERIAASGPLLPAWAEFLVHREMREQLAGAYRATREALAAWVRRGIEAGEIRDLPPGSVAAAATAAIEGLLIQALVDPGFDARDHWRTAWSVFARGIAR